LDTLVYDKARSTVILRGVRAINYKGKYSSAAIPHLIAPLPQRTALIFQVAFSGADLDFAGKHEEASFVSGHAPHIIRPRVDVNSKTAKEKFGRDPAEIMVIVNVRTIIA
jgi:long-chain alkane monooxygenase